MGGEGKIITKEMSINNKKTKKITIGNTILWQKTYPTIPIYFDGKCHFSSKIIPNETTKVTIKFEPNIVNSPNAQWLFGTRVAFKNKSFGLAIMRYSTTSYHVFPRYNNQTGDKTSIEGDINSLREAYFSKDGAIIDGVSYPIPSTAELQTDLNLFIGNINQNGAISSAQGYTGFISEVIIEHEGVIAEHFVGNKIGDRSGFTDIINNTFHISEGLSPFKSAD